MVPFPEALDCLIDLLDAEGRVLELAKAIEQRLDSTDGAVKAQLLVRLGRLHVGELADDARAVRCFGLALNSDPTDRAARTELAKWARVANTSTGCRRHPGTSTSS